MFKYAIIITFVLILSQSFASGVTLQEPSYAGSGCSKETASATLSPDNTALSILFDEYYVEAGLDKKVDRKNCNIAIPIEVPAGYSVSIFQIDYRGFAYIPEGAQGRFNIEYSFAGSRRPPFNKDFNKGFAKRSKDNFAISDKIEAKAQVWSRCGKDINLKIKSFLMAKTNRNGDDVLLAIDSLDIDSGMVYHLQWRSCK